MQIFLQPGNITFPMHLRTAKAAPVNKSGRRSFTKAQRNIFFQDFLTFFDNFSSSKFAHFWAIFWPFLTTYENKWTNLCQLDCKMAKIVSENALKVDQKGLKMYKIDEQIEIQTFGKQKNQS